MRHQLLSFALVGPGSVIRAPALQPCRHGLAPLFVPPVSFRRFLPRPIQRRPLTQILRLDVGAALLDQKLDDFQMAVPGRPAQRRHYDYSLRLDVGAALIFIFRIPRLKV